MVTLIVSREEAQSRLGPCIVEGEEIRARKIHTVEDLEAAQSARTTWYSYVVELLKRLFDDESIKNEFVGIGGGVVGRLYLVHKVQDFRSDMQIYITRLRAIQRKLELIPLRAPFVPATTESEATEQTVFISHSSDDGDVISTVKEAFEDSGLTPIFIEKNPYGEPPVSTIVEQITNSKALFAFLTSKSMGVETRDWIIFELGVAFAKGKKRFAWKEDYLPSAQLPRFTEQVTTYRPFEVRTVPGAHKLLREVKEAARGD